MPQSARCFSGGSDRSEGLRKHRPNRLDHSVRLFENLVVPESQNSESSLTKPIGPSGVLVHYSGGMLPAVNFNHQARPEANEVNDIRANGNLASKSKSIDLLEPQAKP